MGMFDNIIVDANILPDLSQEEITILNQFNNWQSKDFENTLTDIYIVENKELKYRHSFVGGTTFPYKLQIKKSDWVEVPIDQRLHSDVSPLYMVPRRETNIRVVDLDYTGTFIFYTTITKDIGVGAKETIWYEFVGQAENGKINQLKRKNIRFRFGRQYKAVLETPK